jgi:hypothetical protein
MILFGTRSALLIPSSQGRLPSQSATLFDRYSPPSRFSALLPAELAQRYCCRIFTIVLLLRLYIFANGDL